RTTFGRSELGGQREPRRHGRRSADNLDVASGSSVAEHLPSEKGINERCAEHSRDMGGPREAPHSVLSLSLETTIHPPSHPMKRSTEECDAPSITIERTFKRAKTDRLDEGVSASPVASNPYLGWTAVHVGYAEYRSITAQQGELNLQVTDAAVPAPALHPCTYPDCDKVYKRKGNLMVHVRSAHLNEPCTLSRLNILVFPCPHRGCGRGFYRDSDRQLHIASTHQQEMKVRA
ncbi:hypothetical protein BD626DRAFT_513637, partial [Schizophyllum amplum]